MLEKIPDPGWLKPEGGISDTSSDEETEHFAVPPPYPIMPMISGNSELLATWDMLTRPDGISVARLWQAFGRKHGPPGRWWLFNVQNSPFFELFVPHRRSIPPPVPQEGGKVFDDTRKHVNAIIVQCQRPWPLGNPWPVNENQDLKRVCDACEDLMLNGGSVSSRCLLADRRDMHTES